MSKKYSLHGALLSFFADALLPLCGLFTAIYLTRKFGPELYGTYALIFTIINWVEKQIHAFCSPTSITLIGSQNEPEKAIQQSFNIYLILGGSLTIFAFLAAVPISHFLHDESLIPYIRFFSLEIFLFALANSHRAFLTALGDYQQRAFAVSIRWISRLIFIVFFVQAGLSIYGAFLGSILAVLAEFIILRIHIRPNFRLNTAIPFKSFWIKTSHFYIAACFMEILLKLDLVMLKQLGIALDQVGAYAAAQNLAYLPTFFFGSVNLILISKILQLERTGKQQNAKTLVQQTYKLMLWVLPISAIISGSAPEIIIFIYGEKYATAGLVLQSLIFASWPFLVSQTSANIFLARSQAKIALIIIAPAVVIYLISLVIIIPIYGAIGAARILLTIFMIMALANSIILLAVFKLKMPLKSILVNIGITAGLFFTAHAWHTTGFYIFVEAGALLAAMCVALFVLQEITPEQIKMIKNLKQGNK